MSQQAELVITKILNAPKELVFKTWTEAEHLSKWWGPKGMSLAVEQLDLIPGGIFHYSMSTPDGQKKCMEDLCTKKYCLLANWSLSIPLLMQKQQLCVTH